MSTDVTDLTLRALRTLPVLQLDPARSERVRLRCHAARAVPSPLVPRAPATRRFRTAAFGGLLTGVLSAGLVGALVQDLLRVYLRR